MKAYKAYLSAHKGTLLGGVRQTESSWFASPGDAAAWLEQARSANLSDGRRVGEGWIVTKDNVKPSLVIPAQGYKKNPRKRKRLAVARNPRALNPWSILAAMKSGERGTEFGIDARTPITWIVSRQKIGPRHYGYTLPDALTQSDGFKTWMGANSALEIYGSLVEVKRHFEKMMLKKNPAPRSGNAEPEVKQAAKLFQAFTGHRVTSARRVAPPRHKAAIAVGPVLAVAYETTRDGKREQYLHEFRRGARPTLAASSDGRSLLMLGGAFRFTERGIVDK